MNGGGAMPAFKGTLTPEQITNVAAYVSTVAGKSSSASRSSPAGSFCLETLDFRRRGRDSNPRPAL